ncbi:MAG: chromosomal replication initiator protein [Candidatus Tokpelaia sp. JSC188]|nr:MAG: chromosomal replication initiator protein [Candidatus Tokpelaia sp. JSC188]
MNSLRTDTDSYLSQDSPTNVSSSSRNLGQEIVTDQRYSEKNNQQIFERVSTKLKARVGTEAYASWFGRLKLDEYTCNQVRLSVPTAFLRSWINNHYSTLLTELWQEENPSIMRIDIVVRSVSRVIRPLVSQSLSDIEIQSKTVIDFSETVVKAENPTSKNTSVFGSPLDPRYIFENFVEGMSNRVALAAARAIAASKTGELRFNPLFIYASVGLGKTHLLQAIATATLRRSIPVRVVYLTAEYFMWRFTTSIRDNDTLSFKKQLRDIELLIIDDMQFLQGKSIQHEFCHLLNNLLDSVKQVVVAADRPPLELESLDLRVRSRLQGGVSLEISPPDYEMRLKMLRGRLKLARQEKLVLDIKEDVLSHIARKISGSWRDIEGAFNQLIFRQSFEPDLSLTRIDELLGYLTRDGKTKRIRIEEIQRIVARYCGISKKDLLSNRRIRSIVKSRQIAMYLAKIMTSRSLPEIGRQFGGRDHTTVLHAVRKIEGLAGSDQKLAWELEFLKGLINDQTASVS